VKEVLEKKTAITGIGSSAIGRRLAKAPLALTVDACLAAMADAGLAREDIDGVATYPGGATMGPLGYVGPGVSEIQDALGLKLDWSGSGLESTGPLGPLFNACAAVACGFATHVLVYCTVWEASARALQVSGGARPFLGSGDRVGGALQWTAPFRSYSPASWIALYASHHFNAYGTTREQLAQIALNARANAAKNPAAIYRDPLTLDAYLGAPMVSTPLCLYDCDVPADGSIAVVVSRIDAAAHTNKTPLRIEAIGCARHARPSWDQCEDLGRAAGADASAMLWQRTHLKPTDVDVAEIYDGFSFLTLAWLEALGFCGLGESGAFVQSGARIALDGQLPLNTGGGQLSAGRLNGYGLLHEACIQLRREGGARQVQRDPEVALVAAGGGPYGGCVLLTR
jgi:acetyl-CoA acetyltransferase